MSRGWTHFDNIMLSLFVYSAVIVLVRAFL